MVNMSLVGEYATVDTHDADIVANLGAIIELRWLFIAAVNAI